MNPNWNVPFPGGYNSEGNEQNGSGQADHNRASSSAYHPGTFTNPGPSFHIHHDMHNQWVLAAHYRRLDIEYGLANATNESIQFRARDQGQVFVPPAPNIGFAEIFGEIADVLPELMEEDEEDDSENDHKSQGQYDSGIDECKSPRASREFDGLDAAQVLYDMKCTKKRDREPCTSGEVEDPAAGDPTNNTENTSSEGLTKRFKTMD